MRGGRAQVVFNPKDSNTFASASLDRTVKVWSIGQPTPNFTLEGHEKGVNCVDYFTGGAAQNLEPRENPGNHQAAHAQTSRCRAHEKGVWDDETKACMQCKTLKGHGPHHLSATWRAGDRPFLISGADDRTARACGKPRPRRACKP